MEKNDSAPGEPTTTVRGEPTPGVSDQSVRSRLIGGCAPDNQVYRSYLSARVVLPEPEEVESEEELEEGYTEEEGDFLEDFPDETEVCMLPVNH
jgi:hypothetical protein